MNLCVQIRSCLILRFHILFVYLSRELMYSKSVSWNFWDYFESLVRVLIDNHFISPLHASRQAGETFDSCIKSYQIGLRLSCSSNTEENIDLFPNPWCWSDETIKWFALSSVTAVVSIGFYSRACLELVYKTICFSDFITLTTASLKCIHSLVLFFFGQSQTL